METIELTCGACGEINKRAPKPEPENTKECKQIYFICSKCKVKNLRDGTFSGQNLAEEPEELEEDLEEDDETQSILREELGEDYETHGILHEEPEKENSENGLVKFFKRIWYYGKE